MLCKYHTWYNIVSHVLIYIDNFSFEVLILVFTLDYFVIFMLPSFQAFLLKLSL